MMATKLLSPGTFTFGVSIIGAVVQSTAFSLPTSVSRSSRAVTTMSSLPKNAQSTFDAFSLSGKTVLVTGSSGGIGKGIAKAFAEAGADVIVHYNSRREGAISTFTDINNVHAAPSEGRALKPGKCLGIIKADFRDPGEVGKMFEYVTNDILKDDRLDILVNNAGVVTKLAVEDDDDLAAYHETLAVNLHAPLQLMKLAHAHMKSTASKRKGGVIINNTSIHGTLSVEFMTAYAASKAALDSLTRGLALEYAPDGIRVNAVAPGVTAVERTADALAEPNVRDMWTPHLPVGRFGTVDDVAQATLTLATNEWMSGTILTVDGGMMARSNMPFRPRPPKPESDATNGCVNGSEEEARNEAGVLFEVPK
ncbi:hypothetical protein ACHAWF_013299 [Thalassiosira exigua]